MISLARAIVRPVIRLRLQRFARINMEGEPTLTKSQLKKLEKERLKAELKAKKAAQHAEQQAKEQGEDYAKDLYGDLSPEPTHLRTTTVYTDVAQIEEGLKGQVITVRARVHNARVKGTIAFLVLRDTFYTVQCVACKSETISK